jgi:enoyl-CoA hydratase/carnithine racemase
MGGEQLIIEERGPIVTATLNRPEKYNALTLEMLEGLTEATARLAERDDLQVLLVRANGPYFSAGVDLNGDLVPSTDIASPRAFRQWYRTGAGCIHPLGNAWEAIEKPIVMAHQGPCLGGALEISLSADFRLASPAAKYGLPEIAFGGLPGSGGISRLTRLAGPQWARWLVLAGKTIDAERALSAGIVHEIYPAARFEEEVTAFCGMIASQPREAFAAGKLAIELTQDLGRDAARNVERLAASGLVQGDEYRALIAALKAKFAGRKGG